MDFINPYPYYCAAGAGVCRHALIFLESCIYGFVTFTYDYMSICPP